MYSKLFSPDELHQDAGLQSCPAPTRLPPRSRVAAYVIKGTTGSAGSISHPGLECCGLGLQVN